MNCTAGAGGSHVKFFFGWYFFRPIPNLLKVRQSSAFFRKLEMCPIQLCTPKQSIRTGIAALVFSTRERSERSVRLQDGSNREKCEHFLTIRDWQQFLASGTLMSVRGESRNQTRPFVSRRVRVPRTKVWLEFYIIFFYLESHQKCFRHFNNNKNINNDFETHTATSACATLPPFLELTHILVM